MLGRQSTECRSTVVVNCFADRRPTVGLSADFVSANSRPTHRSTVNRWVLKYTWSVCSPHFIPSMRLVPRLQPSLTHREVPVNDWHSIIVNLYKTIPRSRSHATCQHPPSSPLLILRARFLGEFPARQSP